MTCASRRGMTLMELMVGLVITSAMATIGAAAFGSIIDHRRIIKESTVDMERASALRDQLRLWIGSGTVLIQTGGVPNIGGRASAMTSNASMRAAAATGDEISVNTTAANPAHAPSVRMRIFIDGDENTPERGLTIEYQTSNQAPLQRLQLEPSIGGLKVEYLDQRTNRWRPASEAATIQAIAVRVWLLPLAGGHLPAILQVPMIFQTSVGALAGQAGR
ncbi:MAG TPA: type II secretion system protein [Gemmatimonadaceae bacterium]|nr:type II secretion system protein [Gemmatimonadaceae bacterium]